MPFPLDHRIILNLGLDTLSAEYPFIDFLRSGDGLSPFGTAFDAVAPFWQLIDENGYVNHADGRNKTWSASFALPSSAEHPGNWVVRGRAGNSGVSGVARIRVTKQQGTITNIVYDEANSTGVTVVSGGVTGNTFTFDIANGGRCEFFLEGWTGGSDLFRFEIQNTGTSDVSDRLTEVAMISKLDEADFDSGKIYRSDFKEKLLELNPQGIRFYNWQNSTYSNIVRWSQRTPDDWSSYRSSYRLDAAYGDPTGTETAIAVAAIAETPVSMTHGEGVTLRGSAMTVHTKGGSKTITAITKAANAVVTITSNVYAVGDKFVCEISSGMTEMSYRLATISAVNGNDVTTDIDSTSFSDFTSGTALIVTELDAGERGAFPIIRTSGTNGRVPMAAFGNEITSDRIYHLTFDADIQPYNSPSTLGAWRYEETQGAMSTGLPPAVMAGLLNELNDETTDSRPIHGYVITPLMGMMEMDSDYVATDNWGVKQLEAIFALLTHNDVGCWDEDDNENWNTAFVTTGICARRAEQRWGTASFNNWSIFRSILHFDEIATALPSLRDRMRFVVGGQAFGGLLGNNSARYSPSSTVTSDPLWPGGDAEDYYDDFAVAPYVRLDSPQNDADLVQAAADYASATNQAEEAEAIQIYVDRMTADAPADNHNIPAWLALAEDLEGVLTPLGVTLIQYEGNMDETVSAGDADFQTYMLACKASPQMAKAMIKSFDDYYALGGRAPSVFDFCGNNRWGLYLNLYTENQSGFIKALKAWGKRRKGFAG